MFPGYGGCYRCGRSWPICEIHTTAYDDGAGCFPLCKECWQELTPETRLPYYRKLYNKWERDSARLKIPLRYAWDKIEAAVMNGL